MGKEWNENEVLNMIKELEQLCNVSEELSQTKENANKQRFYEGMAIAYTTVVMRLKNEVQQIDLKVINELFQAIEKTSHANSIDYHSTCSFCQKNTVKVGVLAVGPGVSICKECIEFGGELIKSNSSII
ncbi:ClpX C4-type zinc finger protein [Bacillus sp. B1-b2]|uniref:ClpX C4-type zinc finger protein n=1 Tax=Bacillus sp. B1-b2 TaxID=2653201 RepID=UPI001D033826|nr:ClpX C4-type zinc finger protein [Bacillus sp. B1-b2]